MTVDEVANNKQKEGRSSRRRRNRETAKEAQQPAAAQTRDKDRPTPSQRETKQGGNFITRFFRGIAEYFTSTAAELRKVTWPSRQDALRLSGIVLAVTIVSSIALGTIDYLYGQLFRWGISAPIVFIVFFVVLILVYGGVRLAGRQRG